MVRGEPAVFPIVRANCSVEISTKKGHGRSIEVGIRFPERTRLAIYAGEILRRKFPERSRDWGIGETGSERFGRGESPSPGRQGKNK